MKTLIKLITKLVSTATAHRGHALNKTVTINMRTLSIYLMSKIIHLHGFKMALRNCVIELLLIATVNQSLIFMLVSNSTG